jgi:putative phosphoribosyl transferase
MSSQVFKSAKPRIVMIPISGIELEGDLEVPEGAQGIVVFAHGSGSSRRSSRNQFVAGELQRAGFATLLFDLLTEDEDELYQTRFDIDLLTQRLVGAVKWLGTQYEVSSLPIGLFGASTGAAAAMRAAAELQGHVCAVVSRGGRPDLAYEELKSVSSPTLLIVGGEDKEVLALNRVALRTLPISTTKKIEVVAGATHLFEESGALEEVASLAKAWFTAYAMKQDPDWEEC